MACAGRGIAGMSVERLKRVCPARSSGAVHRSSGSDSAVGGSATIEVMDGQETVLGGGHFSTDTDGFTQILAYARQFPERTWAIEGCQGIGAHLAQRSLADGEQVVDVPPKLSARARAFATGQGLKTDATDAHSVALVGTRITGLRPVVDDEKLVVLGTLVDRRRALGEDHTRMVSRLHHLLLQLIPGGAKRDLSAAQAKALLAKVRPRDEAGKTRMSGRFGRLVAGDAIGELAEDVEVAVVPSGLRDQVRDDVPQRERLAGIFVPADCFCVPVAGSNDVVGVGCLLGVLVE
jgi:Transposase